MVKKHDNSWRMCVDFKDLNKACPKDGYPLLEIDWKVESLCGFPFKCFLEVYKGYHQIQMAKEDEEKTAFITSQGIFCYTKMPFGLRNAGTTYQRLVDKTFHKQIGINLKVYVDDLVIKSRTEDEIVRDMEETFQTLIEINMKLNLKKCTFGIEEGMFLGYKVSTRGLKVCQDKVDVVLSLPSLKSLKDVQRLNGKLASLNRFIQISREIITILQNFEKMHEEKRFLLDYGSGRSVQANEATHCRTSHVSRTNGKKRSLSFIWRQQKKRPRVSVKGKILEDFIVERPEKEYLDTLMGEEEELLEPWILFTDRSSCTDNSGAGLILINP
ncbi:reverse transcriptase domain-containing protein [Tanacetum coccineum]|uniref:Reverse transcriptase domain-containing protein n=1 Tax=Tanacetum coccineum TaxID=301880 RepID=A0ABQ4YRR2_9ASTR